jgi:hypothetical protein
MLKVTEEQKSEADGEQRAEQHHPDAQSCWHRGEDFPSRHVVVTRRHQNDKTNYR